MKPNPAQPSGPDPYAASPREVARRHENEALLYLHRFGYLTSAQIGALVYARHAQSLRLARRTLQRLTEHGLVLVREGGIGAYSHYALSLSGAARVWEVYGVEAKSGKDAIREPSAHRDATNWVMIRMHREGYRIWTEREIQTSRAPVKFLGSKIPDGLASDAEGVVTWVECEASRRGGRDMQYLARWLLYTAFPIGMDALMALDSPHDTLHLCRVRFVLAVPSALTFPSRLRHALEQLLSPAGIHVYDWASNRLEFQFGTQPGTKLVVGWP